MSDRHDDVMLIVGGGAKAAAILAHCAAAAAHGLRAPRLIIAEPHDIAANWSGRWGHTDGEFSLGTAPEKDVGFPYEPLVGADWPHRLDAVQVLRTVQARYSWHAFLARDPAAASFIALPDQAPTPIYASRRAIPTYREWIDAGRPSPPHWVWAAYLKWVIACAIEAIPPERGRPRLVHGRVTSLSRNADGDLSALIESNTPSFGTHCIAGLTGVVVTGPGSPFRVLHTEDLGPQVCDSFSYWAEGFFDRVLKPKLAAGAAQHVAIIGAGETGGTIVVDLIRKYRRLQHWELTCGRMTVTILNPDGMIYTRGQGYFENFWYSGGQGWSKRTAQIRADFIRRTDRGVVSPEVVAEINQFRDVAVAPMRVDRIRLDPDGRVQLCAAPTSSPDAELAAISCDAAVDASGFDPLSFRTWLSPELKTFLGLSYLPHVGESLDTSGRGQVLRAAQAIAEQLDRRLAIPLRPAPRPLRLFLPMLAGQGLGPGYANLSCLGLMAQRIVSFGSAPPPEPNGAL